MRLLTNCAARLLPFFLIAAFTTAIAAPAQASTPEIAAVDIPNFAQVDEHLFRGGMPSAHGLEELKAAGVKTVVSLANEKKFVEPERQAAEKLGLNFIFIPLSAWRGPHQNDIDAFLSVMEDKDNGPIFVHCMHGQDRTGAMVAMYRMQHDGWTEKRAYDEMVAGGFHKVFFRMADRVKDFRN